jgi:hypothetical protein
MNTTILLRVLGAASSLTLACCAPLAPYENSREAAERTGSGYSLDTPATGSRYMAPAGAGTRLESTEVTTTTTETTRREPPPEVSAPPPPTTTTTTTVAPAPASTPTYGTPVPGRRGFVYPPGVDTKPENMVDVRDFQPGQKVRDPRTGKIFLVP